MNTLQQAIQVVSKNFVNQIEPGMSMPHGATNDHDTMAYIVSRLEGTSGGYMFNSDRAILKDYTKDLDGFLVEQEGQDIQLGHRIHSVHNYDNTIPHTYKLHNLELFKQLKDGARIILTYEASDYSTCDEYVLTDGIWTQTYHYNNLLLNMYLKSLHHCGYILFEGIRSKVAEAVGMEMTEEFHKQFDKAISTM